MSRVSGEYFRTYSRTCAVDRTVRSKSSSGLARENPTDPPPAKCRIAWGFSAQVDNPSTVTSAARQLVNPHERHSLGVQPP